MTDARPTSPVRSRSVRALLRRGRRTWWDIARAVVDEMRTDNATLAAAGVAFYSFLAVVPGLIALVSLYGLVADPADIERQVTDLLAAAPEEVRDLVRRQLADVAAGRDGGLGVAAAAGALAALWSASTGMKHLIRAINAAYDQEETRGWIRLRGLAVLFTVGALGLVTVAFGVINVVPAALDGSSLDGLAKGAITVIRWPLLGLLVLVSLTMIYRYAPDRDAPRWGWSAPGTFVAVVGWLATSGAFSLYTSRFGTFGETYGSLGAVVVLLLWLLLSALSVIVGAELNAESERWDVSEPPVADEVAGAVGAAPGSPAAPS